MKWITVFLLVSLLTAGLCADELSDRLGYLSTQAQTLKQDLAAKGFYEINHEDEDDDYVCEVFTYLSTMHEAHPEAIDSSRMIYLNQYLQDIENLIYDSKAANNEYRDENLHAMLIDKLDEMVETLILLPDQSDDSLLEPSCVDNTCQAGPMDESLLMTDAEFYSTWNGTSAKETSLNSSGTVKVDLANVRINPSVSASCLTVVQAGTVLSVTGRNGNWLKVMLADGTEGYIYGSQLCQDQSKGDYGDVEGMLGKVCVDAANFRTGPSTSYNVIRVTYRGEKLSLLGKEGNWYKAVYKSSGETGYIYKTLVTVVGYDPDNDNNDNDNDDNDNNDDTSTGGNETITESALGAVGQSDVIYGVDCYTATTEYGNLACAAVVSAILKNADCGNKIHLACVGLREHLKSDLGWSEITSSNYAKGDVCFWRKNMNDRPRHVGVVVAKDVYGKWWAVDNSSSAKKVMKRPLVRSYYPVVNPCSRTK